MKSNDLIPELYINRLITVKINFNQHKTHSFFLLYRHRHCYIYVSTDDTFCKGNSM